ncbi:hypothetical protein CVT24_010744 [Panaeolus cyanescens]|uniref:Muconate cycloisomerase 1 n=1 Tax=Panaeolus cyanescens TaxID=181874 RepID=A0A409YMD0_9AGAR|nr:hypothetical protein CVT24_010744 [Panaeolus cyanescens]
MESLQTVLGPIVNSTAVTAPLHYILAGSFRSVSLFLLAFSPTTRTLSHLRTIPGFGPHQYLALPSNEFRNTVYATSWAVPPVLSSWRIEKAANPEDWNVRFLNSVPITATSSYITIPQPYKRAYSVGGPTGEVHDLDPVDGSFGSKLQEVLFVPEDELATADKTRVALRYGSHGIEFTPSRQFAFVPVLGTDSIEMFEHDPDTGRLALLTSVPSPRGSGAKDGPRHLKIHPNGRVLYCVTEHTNVVDIYEILPKSLKFRDSRSLLPDNVAAATHGSHVFRGDTLMLAPSSASQPVPKVLITTTRGATSATKGWLSVFPLDSQGYFSTNPNGLQQNFANMTVDINAARWETPTSGGRANAIDLIPQTSTTIEGDDEDEDGLWIVLTDEDDATASPNGTGAIRILEWKGWKRGLHLADEWPRKGDSDSSNDNIIQGASHAIWLN